MSKFSVILVLVLSYASFSAHADESFRLSSGKLIKVGNSKQEIISIAGDPIYEDIETVAVDNGTGNTPIKREILTFRLSSSLGGKSLVVVTIENSIATSVVSKQEKRM